MAWNPSPEVAVARDAANKLKAKQAIVIWFTDEGGYGMASYGRDKSLCAEAGKIGDKLYKHVRELWEEDELWA